MIGFQRVFATRLARAVIARNIAVTSTRRYSTEPPVPSHTDFYKTFGRPIAKALMIAMFTYQVLYLGWAKLEQDNIRKQRTVEEENLKAQVTVLRNQQSK